MIRRLLILVFLLAPSVAGQTQGDRLKLQDVWTVKGPVVDVRAYGAVPDAKNSTNFTSTSASAVLNDTNAPWVAADVGKSMRIRRFDTGAVIFKGTISTFTSTSQITLSGTVSYSCAAVACIAVWGTDNATAIQTALTAAAALTTGVTLADLTGQEDNYPLKLGSIKVTFPADSRGSMYLFGTQLTVARKVDIDAQAILFSNVGDGTASDRVWAISASPGAHVTRLELDASFGMGITIGTALTQSHTVIGNLNVWGVGTNSNGALSPPDQTAIQLLGYDWKVGQLWSKGGSIGTKLNVADFNIDYIFPIGATSHGVYFDGAGGKISNILVDTVLGNGVYISSGNDFSFPNISAAGNQATLNYVVNINSMNSAALGIHARNSGGKVIKVKGTADSTIYLTASNIAFGWETPHVITELVEYSTGNSGVIDISGSYDSAIASISSGTRVGTLDLTSESNTTRFLSAAGGIYQIKAKSNSINAGTLEIYNETSGFYWHIPIRANTGDALQFHGNNGTFHLALELGIDGTLNKSVAMSPFVANTVHGDATLYWAYNGTIGATTARAGLFTTVGATGLITGQRFKAAGTALVNTDFAVHANWGAGAAIATITGTDQGWQGTVTAAGIPGASPTLILTFKDGTWTNAPVCISKMTGGSGTITDLSDTASATTLTITFNGTPSAGATYIISAVCMGR